MVYIKKNATGLVYSSVDICFWTRRQTCGLLSHSVSMYYLYCNVLVHVRTSGIDTSALELSQVRVSVAIAVSSNLETDVYTTTTCVAHSC